MTENRCKSNYGWQRESHADIRAVIFPAPCTFGVALRLDEGVVGRNSFPATTYHGKSSLETERVSRPRFETFVRFVRSTNGLFTVRFELSRRGKFPLLPLRRRGSLFKSYGKKVRTNGVHFPLEVPSFLQSERSFRWNAFSFLALLPVAHGIVTARGCLATPDVILFVLFFVSRLPYSFTVLT